MSEGGGLLGPTWALGGTLRVRSTTRRGGLGSGLFATLNLGRRTDDDPDALRANRERLARALGLPAEPGWLRQVHGTRVVRLPAEETLPEADAAWTDTPGTVCAVLTADCLPVVLGADDGCCVAVAHAGWRGLAAGVLEATVAELPAAPGKLRAWLGPAIGPAAFEVGEEVRAAFVDADPAARLGFRKGPGDRWFGDLCTLARQRLRGAGVMRIDGGGWCTVSEPGRFFSHRRDGASTGRMATLAWLASDPVA